MAITFTYTVVKQTHDRLVYQLDVAVGGGSVIETDATLTNAKLVTDSNNGPLHDFLNTTAVASDAQALTSFFQSCELTTTHVKGGVVLPATVAVPALPIVFINDGGKIGVATGFGISGADNETFTFMLDFRFLYINLGWPPNH